MNGINKNYPIELEILTPLSIGSGAEKDWVRGVDFLVDNKCLYKLNMRKMVESGINPNELASYFANKNEAGLKNKLAGKLKEVSDFVIPFPAESTNDVKVFVKNQMTGNPVLTGSSLKGSVRSILFDYLGGESKDGREVFGSSTKGDEFMRFVKFSDAEFDKTELINTKIFNLQNRGGRNWIGGWKHGSNNTDSHFNSVGFNTLYECLMPGQRGYMKLMMSELAYDFFKKGNSHIKDEKKKPILNKGLQFLFGIINNHTKKYLEKEKAFFKKYNQADNAEEIISSIEKLIDQIPQDNSYCILKMSAGSGFHSITGDWQFDDYSINGYERRHGQLNGKNSAKSRKIAITNKTFSLMGFVKLTSIDENTFATKQEEHFNKIRTIANQIKEDLEKERQEQEKALEQQRIQAENQQNFLKALDFVKSLAEEERFEEALEKYNETILTFPDLKQNVIDIDDLQDKVNKILDERKKKEKEQEIEKAKEDKAKGGLRKILEEKYDMGPKNGEFKVIAFKVCQQKTESWRKASGNDSIPNEQQSALFDTLKRLKSINNKNESKLWQTFDDSKLWQQIVLWVGDETAKQWFDEI